MSIEIKVYEVLDWGCEKTPEDVERFEEELAAAIATAYPEASITVECQHRIKSIVLVATRDADGRLDSSYSGTERDLEIEETVRELSREVWDRGNFWTDGTENAKEES